MTTDPQPTGRAPVQASREFGRPSGSVEWWEHLAAWQNYGYDQSARRIAERGGFSYAELTYQLGHEPTTWERTPATYNYSELPDSTPQTLSEQSRAHTVYAANRDRLCPPTSPRV